MNAAHVEQLTNLGVEYSISEDKAFMAKDDRAEAVAHGGIQAVVKCLAIVMGSDEAHAMDLIISAQPD